MLPVSLKYMNAAVVSCLRLLTQRICCALRLAEESAGNNIAAKIAMMAITTNNSIRVNPLRFGRRPRESDEILTRQCRHGFFVVILWADALNMTEPKNPS